MRVRSQLRQTASAMTPDRWEGRYHFGPERLRTRFGPLRSLASRRGTRGRGWFWVISSVVLLGCSGHSAAGTVVRNAGETILHDDSTTYVGRPNGFVAMRNGRILISDAANGNVAEYDQHGSRTRTFGSKGSGPGELGYPASLAIIGDSVLAVLDFSTSRVALFSLVSGAFDRFIPFPVRPWSMSAVGDTLVGGALDPLTHSSIVLVSAAGAPMGHFGPEPALFDRVPATAAIFGQMEALVFSDTGLVTFEVSDALHVFTLRSGVADSVPIPVLRRRGVRQDLLSRIVSQDPGTAQAAVYQSSMPLKLARLNGGHIALVSLDPEYATGRIKGALFLTLIDLPTRRVCADNPIDLPVEPLPRLDFRGDTLLGLYQVLASDSSVKTAVRHFVVDETPCRWTSGAR